MADPDYNAGIVHEQGGNVLRVKSGGSIVLDSGATLNASAGTLTAPSGGLALGKLSLTGFKQKKVTGHNGAGACTCTGAVVGDRVLAIFGQPAAGGDIIVPVIGTDFEAAITVNDQIQQASASDLHLDSFVVLLIPVAS